MESKLQFALDFDASTCMLWHAKVMGISVKEIINTLKANGVYVARKGEVNLLWVLMPKGRVSCTLSGEGFIAGNVYASDGSTDLTFGD